MLHAVRRETFLKNRKRWGPQARSPPPILERTKRSVLLAGELGEFFVQEVAACVEDAHEACGRRS